MSANTPNEKVRFAKYKPVKVNGVFVPELASYPVSIPPILPSNQSFTHTAAAASAFATPSSSSADKLAAESKTSTPSSIQKIIDSIRCQQRRMKRCLTLNLEQIKRHESGPQKAQRKDLSLDIIKTSTSFVIAKERGTEFSQSIGARSNTEANDKEKVVVQEVRPGKVIAKAGSAKALTRTKTVTQPEVMQSLRTEGLKLKLQPEAWSNEIKADNVELIEANIILKEIIKQVWEKYQFEKRKNETLSKNKEVIKDLKVKMQKLNKENAALKSKNFKLQQKVSECVKFLGQIVDQTETECSQKDKLLAKLAKENEYLRNALYANVMPVVPNKDKQCERKTHKRRRKSMDHIESDDENDDKEERKTNMAVKLLVIKYNFERRNRKRNKVNAKENAASNQTTMQDKIKQFGNLKPKQQFIMMGSEEENMDKKEVAELEGGGEINKVEGQNNNENKGHVGSGKEEEEEEEVNPEAQKRLSSYYYL